MRLYSVTIDYAATSLRIGYVRSRFKAEKLAFKLQEDPCYSSADAKWAIEAREVDLLNGYLHDRPNQSRPQDQAG